MCRFKTLLLLLSVLALFVGSAVPVGAAPAQKTEYLTATCAVGPPGWADRWWETGVDQNIHFRDLTQFLDVFLLAGDDWEWIGTLTLIQNTNADADFNGNFWGTSSYRDDGTIGDFDGRFSFPEHGKQTGTARSADGRLMKIVHGVETPIPLPNPWVCAGVSLLVIDPRA